MQFTIDGTTLTGIEMQAAADALAALIADEKVVALRGTATMETVIGVLGAQRAGVPVVPVPADSGPVERDHILGDSGATAVLGESGWSDVTLRHVPVELRPTAASPGVWPEPNPDDVAIIMYTSGTTGLPKGVQIPHRAIAAGLDGLIDAWGWTAADHVAHGLPLFHVHGLILGVLGAWRVGCDFTHVGRPTPQRYAAAVEQGATMLFAVPTIWSRIVNEPDSARTLRSARLLVSGSAALPLPVAQRLRDLTGQMPIERYGMTETMITLSTRHDGERRLGHVGFPIAGVQTRLRDDDGHRVDHDGESIGTLQVRGDTLFAGYLNLPAKTAESFTDDGWFITGDSAAISADGMHRIVGRTSVDIIKSGGYKIGAVELETVLLAQPGIEEVAVVGVPDDDLGQQIVAFLVGDRTVMASDDELIELVGSQLAAHKRPRQIHHVESLPRNAMGKIQKAILTQRFQQ